MARFIFTLCFSILILPAAAQAGNIQYGYNAQGDWVPVSIDGEKVKNVTFYISLTEPNF